MINLHVHTKYSLLDSTNEPEELVKRAVKDGNSAVCVTDHGNIMASVELQKLCNKYDKKFMLGCEFYICDDVNISDTKKRYDHLIGIAMNDIGRLNMNKLVSLSTQYKYYGKPRIDYELLKKYNDGIIFSSACMAGSVSREIMSEIDKFCYNYTIIQGNVLKDKNIEKEIKSKTYNPIELRQIIDSCRDNALIVAKKYHEILGGRFYLEIQAHRDIKQEVLNHEIISISEKLQIPIIVTTDAHYLNKEDQKYHDVWVKIGTTREVGETYNDCYIMTEQEVRNILKEQKIKPNIIDNCIENTEVIASKCNVKLPLRDPELPHVEIPSEFESELDYMKLMCAKGWIEKGVYNKSKEEQQIYKDRLQYELKSLDKMGYLGYFIIVRDYKSKAHEVGISRGCFTGDALVSTKDGVKKLKNVSVGDYVITADGQFNRVNETHKYNIKEDLVSFSTTQLGNIFNTSKCTLDHKVAIYKDNSLHWKEAKDLKIGEYLFSPKIEGEYKYDDIYLTQNSKLPKASKVVEGGIITPIENINILKNQTTSVYDLTVNNFSNYVLNNILVHNSAGGSLVSYLMDITDLDPIPHNLYFERFIDVGALELLEKGIITKKELKIPDYFIVEPIGNSGC